MTSEVSSRSTGEEFILDNFPQRVHLGLYWIYLLPGIQTIQQPPKARSFTKPMNQNIGKVKIPSNSALTSTLLIVKAMDFD